MVVETAALSEVERGEYGRKRGLYAEHLQVWRRACEQANRATPAAGSGERAAERRRVRELEAELQRNAYSTEICHSVQRKTATCSTAKRPPLGASRRGWWIMGLRALSLSRVFVVYAWILRSS